MNDATDSPEPQPEQHVASPATRLGLETEQFGAQVMKACYEQITQLRTMWAVTPQSMQDEILDRMRTQLQAVVTTGVRRIVGLGFEQCQVTLKSLSADGGKAKAALIVAEPELHKLVDALGKKVVLVLVDPADYALGMEAVKSQADQNALPLGDEA
jgi:hypothetical protein